MLKNFGKELAIFFLIVIIAFITFYPSFLNLNFFWDDERFIFFNPEVLQAPHWYSFWIQGTPFYKSWSLGYSLFWVLMKYFPLKAFFYKTLNILLHSLNAFIFYKLLKRLNFVEPLFLSLFFLVHPLQVETVSWIFQLLTILSFTFFILSFNSLLRFIQKGQNLDIILSLVLFIFSLWTKSIAIFAPFFFVVIFWIYKQPLKKYFFLIPFFIISFYLGISNLQGTDYQMKLRGYSKVPSAILPDKDLTAVLPTIKIDEPKTIITNNDKTYFDFIYNKAKVEKKLDQTSFDRIHFFQTSSWHYIEKLFFPLHLQFIYPKKSANPLLAILAVIITIAIPASFYFKTKERKYFLISGTSVFFLIPFVGLNFITFFYWSDFADRYAYYFVIILSFIVGFILNYKNSPLVRRVLLAFFIALFVMNVSYGYKFNDPISLYREIIKDRPHPAIYSMLIEQYLLKMDIKNAEYFLHEGLRQFPSDPQLQNQSLYFNSFEKKSDQ